MVSSVDRDTILHSVLTGVGAVLSKFKVDSNQLTVIVCLLYTGTLVSYAPKLSQSANKLRAEFTVIDSSHRRHAEHWRG